MKDKNKYPKIMEVSSLELFQSYKRAVVIGKSSLDKYVCLINANELEDMGEATGITTYSYAREIDPFRELKEAYKQGKTIQVYNTNLGWIDLSNPVFDSRLDEYRIKPEPKYIPFDFSDAEKLVGKIVKTKSDFVATIVSVYIDDVVIIGNVQYTLKTLFESFTFLDGSTCGKLKQD